MNALDKYISDYSTPEDALLAELDRETNLRVVQPRMISGHIQGKLLEMIVKMVNPRSILEIGTFTGYSALCMAAGLNSESTIDTIEIDDELESLARSFFDRSAHRSKIKHHIGSALELAPKLDKTFDLIFIDGDKREYPAYYEMIMGQGSRENSISMVKKGTIIIADNILWYGKVVEEIPHNDLFTKGIIEFNRLVCEDDRVENVIIPVRDGLNLIRVK